MIPLSIIPAYDNTNTGIIITPFSTIRSTSTRTSTSTSTSTSTHKQTVTIVYNPDYTPPVPAASLFVSTTAGICTPSTVYITVTGPVPGTSTVPTSHMQTSTMMNDAIHSVLTAVAGSGYASSGSGHTSVAVGVNTAVHISGSGTATGASSASSSTSMAVAQQYSKPPGSYSSSGNNATTSPFLTPNGNGGNANVSGSSDAASLYRHGHGYTRSSIVSLVGVIVGALAMFAV